MELVIDDTNQRISLGTTKVLLASDEGDHHEAAADTGDHTMIWPFAAGGILAAVLLILHRRKFNIS